LGINVGNHPKMRVKTLDTFKNTGIKTPMKKVQDSVVKGHKKQYQL